MPRARLLLSILLLPSALLSGEDHRRHQSAAAGGAPLAATSVTLGAPAEVVMSVEVQCDACEWGRKGREGAVLRAEVDGAYSQHLLVPLGPTFTARVLLGPMGQGTHPVTLHLDASTPAEVAGAVTITRLETTVIGTDTPEHAAVAHSPIIHARPGSLSAFSDVPLLVWYGTEESSRGTWIRYSVIFSNEDGGTPPDRLMATWGRLTDIEYVYGVELDAEGRVLAEEYQGPEHKYLPFEGAHEGRHPVLHVVTQNNMVSDRGGTDQRFALAPSRFQIADAAREVVMDASPWLYRVSAEEAVREGRVDPSARPGSGKVADPRRFVYVEACGETENAALAFDVGFAGNGGGLVWAASDGNLPEYRLALGGNRQRIERPGGCFRAAVAAPPGAGRPSRLRWRAYSQPMRREDPMPPRGSGRALLTRINRVFQMGDDHVPGPSLLEWRGDLRIPADGAPVEMPLTR